MRLIRAPRHVGILIGVVWLAGNLSGLTQGAAPKLELRLIADRATYTVGDPVTIQVELVNRSDAPQPYWTPQGTARETGLLVTRDGEPVRYVAGSFSTGRREDTLGAGDRKIIDTLRLSDYWDVRRPGRYGVQFKGNDRERLPESPVLEFDVELPPNGEIPPLDLNRRVRIAGREFRMGDHGNWLGAAVNYRPATLGNSGEEIGAALSTVWADAPGTTYDGREIAILARLRGGREGDTFDVRTAELDGQTIRLAIDHKRASEGPGRMYFLKMDLKRLLGPGTYTFTLDVTVRREEPGADPTTGHHEFTFEVQAGPTVSG